MAPGASAGRTVAEATVNDKINLKATLPIKGRNFKVFYPKWWYILRTSITRICCDAPRCWIPRQTSALHTCWGTVMSSYPSTRGSLVPRDLEGQGWAFWSPLFPTTISPAYSPLKRYPQTLPFLRLWLCLPGSQEWGRSLSRAVVPFCTSWPPQCCWTLPSVVLLHLCKTGPHSPSLPPSPFPPVDHGPSSHAKEKERIQCLAWSVDDTTETWRVE